MPAPTTRSAVDRLLAAVSGGDGVRIAEQFCERVDWKLNWPLSAHGSPQTPWIRHRSTRAEAAENFAQLAEHHDPNSVDTVVERILVDGDDAVVLGEIRRAPRATGHGYRARFALHLTVTDDRISRFHIYEDSLSVALAFGHTV